MHNFKALRKASWSSYLENVYLKKRTSDSLINLKNKRITVAGFTKNNRENISKVLMGEGSLTAKVFGKIYNLFSLKMKISSKITLIHNKENASIWRPFGFRELNKFLENARKGLWVNENSHIFDEINSSEKAINKYRNCPSVLIIKSRLKNIPSFHLLR